VAIELDPNDATAYCNRGLAWRSLGDFDRAIADCSEAIRLDPKLAWAYTNRSNAWLKKGDLDKAIADCDEAIRLDPRDATAYCNRGVAWRKKGDYERALADDRQAIRLDPNDVYSYNVLASLLATCPDENYRNGKRAIELATKACEMTGWKDGGMIDTLAAACAEAGDFANAVKWQTKACEFAPETRQEDCRARLALYQAGMPFRQ